MSDIPVKMGRPPLEPGSRAAKPLTVYLTTAEMVLLRELALKEERSISALARNLIKRGMKP